MSQNTSVDSNGKSKANQSINPALQAALATLDVELEEELARYRRQRAGRPVIANRGLGRNQVRKPLELIPVEQVSGKPQQLALGMSTAPVMSFPLPTVKQTPVAEPPQETISEPSIPTQKPDIPDLNNATTSDLATSARESQQQTPEQKPANEGESLANVAPATASPEDYLASSEKLLQSLSQEETKPQPQKRTTDNKILTPLSVGSILLLLLCCATIVYIFKNPSAFKDLKFDRLFESKTSTTDPGSTQQTVTATSESPKESPMVTGPNLAAGEFPEVNINTLSNLPVTPTPIATPSPVGPVPVVPNLGAPPQANSVPANTAPSKGSSDLAAALLPSSGQRNVGQSRVPVPEVAPLPQLSNPTVNKKPQASAATGDSNYYVVLNYSADRSLEQARAIVPNAYVRDFPKGSLIQLGAFARESDAKNLLEKLQKQGLSASIYRP
jgi:hypothetical protein